MAREINFNSKEEVKAEINKFNSRNKSNQRLSPITMYPTERPFHIHIRQKMHGIARF